VLTTLQLANAIAHAVLRTAPYGDPAQAVLRTLRQHRAWFYRLTEDADGCTVETPYEPVQQWLFDDPR
jgi:hypothetical protein